MSNQIAGLRLTGTVTGEGNINLTSIVPNVGSVAASNLTVGQAGWGIVQAGSGATFQREIVWLTYIADSPGAGVMERGEVNRSTSANAKIQFAADTTVIVEFDVPDVKIPHQKGDSTWHLLDELATALGLAETTDNLTVTAGNLNTLLTANVPEAEYEVSAFNVNSPGDRVRMNVVCGPDDGGGDASSADVIVVTEAGNLTVEQSGLAINIRNNSGSAITFKKTIQRIDRV